MEPVKKPAREKPGIKGILIGGIAILALIVVGIVLLVQKKRKP